MRVLLDTNILTRIINTANADFHDRAEASVEALRNGGHIPCLVPQNIYEFWSVATRPTNVNGLGMTPMEAKSEVDQFLPLFQLLRDERSIFERWLNLVADNKVVGKPSHDARLVAALLRHGLTHLVTFNQKDFSRYNAITVVTPDQLIDGTIALAS